MRILPVALILGGCASVSTQLPDITAPQLSAEQTRQEVLAFENLDRLQQRLMQVALPVLKANTELCPKTRQSVGVVMHSLKNYPKSLHPAAKRELNAGVEPTVRLIINGSAAEAAGIKIGDQFLSSEGKVTTPTSKAFQSQLKAGEPIQIRRGGKDMAINLKSETVCGYKVRLSISSTINAYADGRHITMTSGMMNFVEDDDELAQIVGHELAHNTMGHIRKIITNFVVSLGGTRYTRPFETEADYVGMYYMVRAGYNPDDVEEFWRRLALNSPKYVARDKTHPRFPNRYLSLAATREEIKAKQAAGLPLIPNFKAAEKKS
ncbi:M48 family metallopeptidase [Hellea sp.]|nr:M48 family metallopeptidase [Hellea sp.]